MISKLKVKNFQSHGRDSVLELCPGVNVVTGRSQAGKTALLRALVWLAFNRPLGNRFRSHWCGKGDSTKVEVVTEEGHVVSLERGNSTAVYTVNGQEFRGFGKEVPDKVREALNIDEINVQRQLDSPFLVTASAGEVASVINKVVRLEKVDEWVSGLTSRINSAARRADDLVREIDSLEKRKLIYSDLDRVGKIADRIDRIETSLAAEEKELAALEEMDQKLVTLRSDLDILTSLNTAEQAVGELDKAVAEEKELHQELTLLQEAIKVKGLIDCLGHVDEVSKESSLISQLGEELNSLVSVQRSLMKAEEELVRVGEVLHDTVEEYKQVKSLYLSALEEEKVCPVCGSDIRAMTIMRLFKEV